MTPTPTPWGKPIIIGTPKPKVTSTPQPPVSYQVSGYLWIDRTPDGIRSGEEPGLLGVRVALYQGAACRGTPIAVTHTANTTRGAGYYRFPVARPGIYSVRFYLPAGWAWSPPRRGLPRFSSAVDPQTGCIPQVMVRTTHDTTLWNGGAYRPDRGERLTPKARGRLGWHHPKHRPGGSHTALPPVAPPKRLSLTQGGRTTFWQRGSPDRFVS